MASSIVRLLQWASVMAVRHGCVACWSLITMVRNWHDVPVPVAVPVYECCWLLGSQLYIGLYFVIVIVDLHSCCSCWGALVALGGKVVVATILMIEEMSTLLTFIHDCWQEKQTNARTVTVNEAINRLLLLLPARPRWLVFTMVVLFVDPQSLWSWCLLLCHHGHTPAMRLLVCLVPV